MSTLHFPRREQWFGFRQNYPTDIIPAVDRAQGLAEAPRYHDIYGY